MIIIIVIVTRIKWTKHGRKVTKRIIVADSIFFSALATIFIFDSFYNIGVQILYLIPYLILFLACEHISYMHSNRLISFWKDPNSGSIYVKGGTRIHYAYIIGTASRLIISVLFIGGLFASSREGIIHVDNSASVLATMAFDLLLMICFGLLIGINRRVLIRYNLIKEGKEEISER